MDDIYDADTLLLAIGRAVLMEAWRPELLNTDRAELVNTVSDAISEVIKGGDIDVQSGINPLVKSVGYVRVIGKNVIITDCEAFARLVAIASNVEVYPNIKGEIEISFTFHGMTGRG